jgi:cell division inhibitor SepF
MSSKLFNKFLNFIGLEENIMDEDPVTPVNNPKDNQKDDLLRPDFVQSKRRGKVVNIHSSSYIKVVIYQPVSYDDTQTIIDNLKNRKPVVVNLETLDIDLAQRVLDFMSGAVYSLDGTIQKISKAIFILAPSNVDIAGNIPDELKGKSFYTLAAKKEHHLDD